MSDALPGSTHDPTASRTHRIIGLCKPPAAHGRAALSNKGHQTPGSAPIPPTKVPADGNSLDVDTVCRHALLSGLRCLGERAAALHTTRWEVLDRITLCPNRIGCIAKAALELTQFERVGRYALEYVRDVPRLYAWGARWSRCPFRTCSRSARAARADLTGALTAVTTIADTATTLLDSGTSTVPAHSPQNQALASLTIPLGGQLSPLAPTWAEALSTAPRVLSVRIPSVFEPTVVLDQVLTVATGLTALDVPAILHNLTLLP
ncbi:MULTISPECIES: transposase family protein [unclassified Rhodococcus (in: high G+C Gram-positive bacteria)]|uniref:transposase family protein n=1 Tax=unclassified Rhodococcus (in: high G+C Gram-positive bacteria) TaxID=192944 RepID=UPI000A81D17E|nr:transposase family protein [Rhodococcus sp. M8]